MSSLRVVNVSLQEDMKPLSQTPLENDELRDPPDLDALHIPYRGIESMSDIASPASPSVFDVVGEAQDDRYTELTTGLGSGQESDEQDSYNLKPPPITIAPNNLEALTTRFFSVDHLEEILLDPRLAHRFTQFLAQYRSKHSDDLKQYAEARKAVAAIEYANAIAARIQGAAPAGQPLLVAAALDGGFDARIRRIEKDLVEEALPAYLTHRLVSLVTDTLVREITGNSAPVLHDLIPSLAEVYCVTDVSMPDNPIIYASEEFYSTSQYSRDYVIGRNCRFLQGPESSPSTMRRMIAALRNGEEICETILNYRRDGSPFMNLLMIAPLYDNKGVVRYFLGCQIDVSSLVEDGRGLESFARLLHKDRFGGADVARDPNQILGNFSKLLTEDEANVVQNRPAKSFVSRTRGSIRSTAPSKQNSNGTQSGRVVLGMDDANKSSPLWPDATLGHSGRLPGVYQNYMLVRPYPSLRITFTSPALRIPGLLQTKLLDRVGGPAAIRDGLLDALAKGTDVTAKIAWLTSTSDFGGSKTRWIHCTPLFGSDDKVGVWMVVMVADEHVTGSLNPQGHGNGTNSVGPGRSSGVDQPTAGRLYADFLKRQGRPSTATSQQGSSSTREREAEEHFRDF